MTAGNDLFADDPRAYFGTASKMFAVPYEEIQAIQLEALQRRFASLCDRVPLLGKLAERNKVDGINSLADGSRLLYPSNVYKSYVASWLDEGDYVRLTGWLQQLTAHDLSCVETTGTSSLDEWFTRLEAVTPLRVCHSSSTSGKLSFVPRGVDEWTRRAATLLFPSEAAGHDDGPECVSFEGLPVVLPFYRSGHSAAVMHFDWFIRVHTDPAGTHPERVLTLYEGTLSSDLMVLAGRLRSGQLSGDPRSIQLPPHLQRQRDRLTGLLEGVSGDAMAGFVTAAAERFGGQRSVVTGVWPTMVDAAQAAAKLGLRRVFASDSYVLSGGGEKGRSLPPDAHQLVRDWTGVKGMTESYGMSELMGKNARCSRGRFHLNPWLIPFVLDEDSLEALPANGTRTGRFAGIDLLASSYWSGYISTDRVNLTWDPVCACGRNGPYLDYSIERVGNVDDDKISCAATPQAHDDAIEFLTSQGA